MRASSVFVSRETTRNECVVRRKEFRSEVNCLWVCIFSWLDQWVVLGGKPACGEVQCLYPRDTT